MNANNLFGNINIAFEKENYIIFKGTFYVTKLGYKKHTGNYCHFSFNINIE